MKDDFFKFPSTPHLSVPSGVDIRMDKVMPESERIEFLRHYLVVEEKVDGANLGFSFDLSGKIRAQNRGTYLQLPGSGQWKKLEDWLTPRTYVLLEHLTDQLILFGEWCYAKHSVFYNKLPDWFLGFDIYDKQSNRFFSTGRRNEIFEKMGIAQVPGISRGIFTYPEIKKILSISKLSDQPAEGLYLRLDQGNRLSLRAKLVRSSFIQTEQQHWSRSNLIPNRLEKGGG